jgi:hypothetical protein
MLKDHQILISGMRIDKFQERGDTTSHIRILGRQWQAALGANLLGGRLRFPEA